MHDTCLLSLLASLVLLVALQVGVSRWLHLWLAERFVPGRYRWLVWFQVGLFLAFFGGWLIESSEHIFEQDSIEVMLLVSLYAIVGLFIAIITNKMFGIRYGRIPW